MKILLFYIMMYAMYPKLLKLFSDALFHNLIPCPLSFQFCEEFVDSYCIIKSMGWISFLIPITDLQHSMLIQIHFFYYILTWNPHIFKYFLTWLNWIDWPIKNTSIDAHSWRAFSKHKQKDKLDKCLQPLLSILAWRSSAKNNILLDATQSIN